MTKPRKSVAKPQPTFAERIAAIESAKAAIEAWRVASHAKIDRLVAVQAEFLPR